VSPQPSTDKRCFDVSSASRSSVSYASVDANEARQTEQWQEPSPRVRYTSTSLCLRSGDGIEHLSASSDQNCRGVLHSFFFSPRPVGLPCFTSRPCHLLQSRTQICREGKEHVKNAKLWGVTDSLSRARIPGNVGAPDLSGLAPPICYLVVWCFFCQRRVPFSFSGTVSKRICNPPTPLTHNRKLQWTIASRSAQPAGHSRVHIFVPSQFTVNRWGVCVCAVRWDFPRLHPPAIAWWFSSCEDTPPVHRIDIWTTPLTESFSFHRRFRYFMRLTYRPPKLPFGVSTADFDREPRNWARQRLWTKAIG